MSGVLRRRLDLVAAAIVLVALACRAVVGIVVGLDGDEAYYAMWSAWLAPGYLDHPPGVAVSIAVGRALFGDTLLGVRFVALLASALTVAALYRLSRLLLPHPLAPAVVVIWYSLAPIAGISFVATPDAPSTLFWTLGLWAAAEAVSQRRPNWWLAAGTFAGLGLASKYTNAWLGIGFLLYLLATSEGRAELRRWQLWGGGLLAVLVFSPVVWWNATHGWRSFTFQGARLVTFKQDWGRPFLEFLLGQALAVGPVLLLCSALGIVWHLSGRGRRAGARLALPVLTSLPLLLYFLFHGLHSKVEVNWTQPLLPAMTLVGVGWLLMTASRAMVPWVRAAASIVQPVIGLLLVGLIYVQASLHPLDIGVLDRTRLLRGWEGLAAGVRQFADEAGAQAIWTMGNYRLTGELYFHGRAAGDPRPVRDLQQPLRYDFIPPGERWPTRFPAIVVIEGVPASATPGPQFGSWRLLGSVDRGGPGDRQETYTVFAVADPTADFPGSK